MIRYALKCAGGHGFDSWFPSAAGFDALSGAGLLECPHCGRTEVEKAPMAPQIGAAAPRPEQAPPPARDQESAVPAGPTDQAPGPPETLQDGQAGLLARLRDEVERNSDYVGDRFAEEARAIQSGEAPRRSIHGEARADVARSLAEEGLPVLPLPFKTGRKAH